MSRAVPRNRGLIESHASDEFNLCPMCWMPLFINRSKKEDEIWGYVQYVVKGKPAFSVKPSGAKMARHVIGFGNSELNSKLQDASSDPELISNCQDCHFIDVSLNSISSAYVKWRNIGKINLIQVKHSKNDDSLLGFFPNLNIVDGMWREGTFDFVCKEEMVTEFMQNFKDSNVFEIVSGTFSGCLDCNGKMTNNKYIQELFKLLLPSSTTESTRTTFEKKGRGRPPAQRPKTASVKANRTREGDILKDTESQMHYIILSGMLKQTDLLSENGQLKKQQHELGDQNLYYYSVNERDRLTWEYRYLILWCLIKILFAAWEDNEIASTFRHHVSYVYDGVKDFYLSLLFFVMHCANGRATHEFTSPLRFDVFHFFYSSHLPFFLSSQGKNRKHHRSLSHFIFEESYASFTFKTGKGTKREIADQFSTLKKNVLDFWNNHFVHLSNFIHGVDTDEQSPYTLFFCNQVSATEISDACKDLELDIQSFRTYFTSYPGYWFHFKNITMPRIERDCQLYLVETRIPFVKRVWIQWYAHLCTCINELGVEEARAAQQQGLRSRFFFSPRPNLNNNNATAAILQSLAHSTTRWRVVVMG